MFCKKCGKLIDDDSLYCQFCGESQKQTFHSSYHQKNDDDIKIDNLNNQLNPLNSDDKKSDNLSRVDKMGMLKFYVIITLPLSLITNFSLFSNIQYVHQCPMPIILGFVFYLFTFPTIYYLYKQNKLGIIMFWVRIILNFSYQIAFSLYYPEFEFRIPAIALFTIPDILKLSKKIKQKDKIIEGEPMKYTEDDLIDNYKAPKRNKLFIIILFLAALILFSFVKVNKDSVPSLNSCYVKSDNSGTNYYYDFECLYEESGLDISGIEIEYNTDTKEIKILYEDIYYDLGYSNVKLNFSTENKEKGKFSYCLYKGDPLCKIDYGCSFNGNKTNCTLEQKIMISSIYDLVNKLDLLP